jgi:acetylornithine deacetylase/succinyl-diaminopimelate desuccinylase-like protein
MNTINPPANEDQCAVAHQTDEYCEVARIIEAGRIFSEFVLDRCAA